MKNGVFWDVTPCGSCKKSVTLPFEFRDEVDLPANIE
jgi:hypothetical protein